VSATLVLHPGALGDVLLAIPALRVLRARGETLTIAAQPRIGALLVTLGVADEAVSFDTLGLEVLFTDAPLAADAPLARLLTAAGGVVCWFGARDAHFAHRLRALASDAVIAAPAPTSTATAPTVRVWEHLVSTVRDRPAASLPKDVDVSPVATTSTVLDQGRVALEAAGWDGHARLLIVHPGAGGAAKCWPAEGFAAVLESLDATVVVHEGPADADAVRACMTLARRDVLHLAHPSLPALAGALSLATGYLGNDSGVSHLASAVGARATILFTAPALAWLPWSPTARCLTVTTARVVDAERAAVGASLEALD
jgi:ADP-heptose:LPS heptosyltransferase